MSSSTSSSRPLIPWGGLWCAVFFVALELCFRLLPLRFYACFDQHAYERDPTGDYVAINLAIERWPEPEVVVLGTSRAREGIAAPQLRERLEAALGREVIVANYGSAAGRIDIVLGWYERLIAEGHRPHTVVLALDASGLRNAEAVHRFRTANLASFKHDAARNCWPNEAGLSEILGNSVPLHLVLARPTLRYRLQQAHPWPPPPPRGAAFGELTAWAHTVNEGLARGQDLSLRTKRKRDLGRAVRAYRMSPVRVERLRTLIQKTKRDGVRLVLIEIPVARPLRVDSVTAATAQLRQLLREMAAEPHVSVWTAQEVERGFKLGHYFDAFHLNSVGARQLTDLVAPTVIATFEPPR